MMKRKKELILKKKAFKLMLWIFAKITKFIQHIDGK